ncbi:MAG TPA: CPBP family intramembrane glutamic endopeptidase [Phycisphaerae bacterium]|nr:CPBP family intramembrane glutamic endopeptidase [Phycisphaerae bacterium]
MSADFPEPQPGDIPPAVPVARPVLPPEPASVGGRDLLMGVAIIWCVELSLGVAAGFTMGFQASLTGQDLPTDLAMGLPAMWICALTLASNAGAAVVCWYFLCRKYDRSVTEGFALGPRPVSSYVICILVGALAAFLGAVVLGFGSTGESPLAEMVSTPEGLTAFTIIALVVPLFEELYYRGFLFPILSKTLGASWGVLIVTLWFGGVHSFQLAGDWIGIPIVMAMGLIWTLQRHYTGSLLPSILTHWTYNACLIALGYLAQE